ncbi:efflux RND transporter permease subunit [Catellatospora sp. KI3]|uniref:efflux RND transporter permease subunit n=1 Tax=Catellatospora sp. KI3 TaxID=3041620 RepID=UPI0024830A5D|nr:efflux RND transporter permease subunit [Catellatospora sp. KI3]MDI1462481.1 efflux RND transporter permease subunit [Catellatospora sp. KI3]
MMRWIIRSSLKFRLLVIPVAALLMFFGATSLTRSASDVLPEFSPTTVEIQTEALGLSAPEVEQFITVPLEQDLLNGVPWLESIRSQSLGGLSQVDLVFEPGTDVLRARQAVQERLTQAVALPHVSKAPNMIQPVSSTSRVMVVGLSSPDVSLIDMSLLAHWQVKPRLMGVPGVANVSIWGERERQLQVQVDPEQLAEAGVTLTQVVETTGNALWVSPLTFVEASTPGTSGFVETPNQRLSIQHILPIHTAADLAKVPLEQARAATGEDQAGQGPVQTGGKTMRLGDVATVTEDHQLPLIGDALVGDKPGLMLVVEKFPGANTLDVTKGVEEALHALEPGMTGVQVDTSVYRPATFIESALGNLRTAVLLSILLAVILIGALLLDWRAALIALVVIPLSLLLAVLVLHLRGGGVNMLVLAGLMFALTVVVHDVVTETDNTRRGLVRREGEPATEQSFTDVVLRTRVPLLYATLIVLAGLAPLLFIGGLTGAFTAPVAWSCALAVLASLLLSLTLTPVLTWLLYRRADLPAQSPALAWLSARYQGLSIRAARHPKLALASALVLALAGPLLAPLLGGQALLPVPQDRNLLVRWTGVPSMSQQEMVRVAGTVGAQLRATEGVSNVGVHVGRAINSDQAVGMNSGEFWLTLDPKADYTATTDRIQAVVDQYPGFDHRVVTYPAQQVNEAATGTKGDLVVRIYGKDLDTLRAKAQEVRGVLGQVDGVTAQPVDLGPDQATIEVEVDLAKAEQYGIKPGDVRRSAAVLISGLTAGSLFEEQKVFDVVVLGTPSVRDSVAAVGNLLIDTPSGGHVKLSDVADVRMVSSPVDIRHDAVSRRVDIPVDVTGRPLDLVARDIQGELKNVSFPVEYHAEVLGDYTTAGVAQGRLLALLAVSLIAAYLLLQAAFGSWRLAALLMLLLPASLFGGVLLALLTGVGVSIGSLLGLGVPLALAVREGVLLIRGWQQAQASGVRAPYTAGDRFGPVVTTALAVAAALVPMLALGNVAGLEILRPLAVTALGGLVTAVLLILYLLPVLFGYFYPARERPAAAAGPAATPSTAEGA